MVEVEGAMADVAGGVGAASGVLDWELSLTEGWVARRRSINMIVSNRSSDQCYDHGAHSSVRLDQGSQHHHLHLQKHFSSFH